MKTFALLLIALFAASTLAQTDEFAISKFNGADVRVFAVSNTGWDPSEQGITLEGVPPSANFPSQSGNYVVTMDFVVPDPGCTPQEIEMYLVTNHPKSTVITLTLEDPNGNTQDLIVPGQMILDSGYNVQLDDDEASDWVGPFNYARVPGGFNPAFTAQNPTGNWTLTLDDPPRPSAGTTGTFDIAVMGFWCTNEGTAQGDPHVTTLSGENEEFIAEDGSYNLFSSEQTVVNAKFEAMPIIGGEAPAQYMSKVAVELTCGEEKVHATFDNEGVHFSEGSEEVFNNGACTMVSTSNPQDFHKDVAQKKLAKFDFYSNAHQVSFYTLESQVFVFYTGHHYNVRVVPLASASRSEFKGILAEDNVRDVALFKVADF